MDIQELQNLAHNKNLPMEPEHWKKLVGIAQGIEPAQGSWLLDRVQDIAWAASRRDYETATKVAEDVSRDCPESIRSAVGGWFARVEPSSVLQYESDQRPAAIVSRGSWNQPSTVAKAATPSPKVENGLLDAQAVKQFERLLPRPLMERDRGLESTR